MRDLEFQELTLNYEKTKQELQSNIVVLWLCRVCQFLQYFATNYKNIIIDFQTLTLFEFVNIAKKQTRIEKVRQNRSVAS